MSHCNPTCLAFHLSAVHLHVRVMRVPCISPAALEDRSHPAQMADRQIVPFGEQAVAILKHAAFQLGAFAVFCLKQWWSHVAASHPSSLFQAARSNDLQKLQGLLHRAPRDTAGGLNVSAQSVCKQTLVVMVILLKSIVSNMWEHTRLCSVQRSLTGGYSSWSMRRSSQAGRRLWQPHQAQQRTARQLCYPREQTMRMQTDGDGRHCTLQLQLVLRRWRAPSFCCTQAPMLSLKTSKCVWSETGR